MSQAPAADEELRCAARLVAAMCDLAPEDFTGPKKGAPPLVHARQVLCYLLHTEGGLDQVVISTLLNRHRSTVGHAIQVVAELRDNADVDRAVTRLGEMYRDLRDARAKIPALLEEIAP